MSSATLPIASRQSAAPTLSVQIQKRYGGPHNRFHLDMTFSAQPGVTVFLGHSGAGKTTVLRCIAGLCDPDNGRIAVGEKVLFDAREKVRLDPAKRNVAFVFQDLALFPHLTVQENVSYGLRKMPVAERKERVAAILKSFQIAHLHNRLPRETSGGEQQRIALARSLVTEPSVLLLDEPLSSLDVNTKASIIDDLRAWNNARRIPMLYVTHSYDEVFALGDRAITLEHGRIGLQGIPMDVVPASRRETMVQIAGFENLLDADVVGLHEQQGTTTCHLSGTRTEIQVPLTRVSPGDHVHVGIRANEIFLAAEPPKVIGACNVLSGRVKKIECARGRAEVLVDCGTDFRVHVPADSVESLGLSLSDEVWMLIKPQAVHLIRPRHMRASQRLFVFVCNGNRSRSPIAQAICNAEIARRLRVPLESLASIGIQAVSAGLSATPGNPISEEAKEVLEQLKVPMQGHRTQKLSEDLAAKAEVIFCMTEAQRQIASEMFPEAAYKMFCLRPGMDFEEPGQGEETFLHLAEQVQGVVHQLMDTLLDTAAAS